MTHVVLTGPIRDTIELADGTVYDVSPHVVEVQEAHAGELAHRIALLYEERGHPHHTPAEPFVHHCTALCGEHARNITDPMAAAAAVKAQQQTDRIFDAIVRAHHAEQLGTGDAGDPSMALASTAAENAALNGLDGTGNTNVIPDVSLHTASPSTTGVNENANSGGYARQACSWNPASGGAKTNSSTLAYSTLGTVPVTHFGTQSSPTYGAGNYALGGALASAVTAASITVAAGAFSLGAS